MMLFAVLPLQIALLSVPARVSLAQGQPAHEFPIFGLQFSPDGKFLAAASSSDDPPGPIVIWNVDGWTVHRVHRSTKGSLDVDFSPDGTQLAYATKSGIVGVLEVASGKVVREIHAHGNAVYSIAFSPDVAALASSGADRSIKLWNLSTGTLIRQITGHKETVGGVAISPDGARLVSGSFDTETRLWELPSGNLLRKFKTSDTIVRRVDFSDDGKYFLACSWGGDVRIRETGTCQLRALLKQGTDCADITADNRFVATSGRDSTADVFAVELRDATDEERQRIAQLIEQLRDDRYENRDAASKEIARIGMLAEPQLREAMNHVDAEVRLRSRRLREEVLSPEPIARLSGHRGDVEVVSFSPDGRLLATACRGGDIKVWSTSDYREVAKLSAAVDGSTKAQ
jgi:WD40 repeat protein